jgi:hypothetical protein
VTIVPFPSAPSPQSVLATVYRLGDSLPRWSFSMEQGDGTIFVDATSRVTGITLSAAHEGGVWLVHGEGGIVSRSPSLTTALEEALAA